MTVARDLMKPAGLTIRPDADLLEVLHLFVEAQLRAAPIVDETGKVHGVISSADLLGVVDQLLDDDVDELEGDADEPRGQLEQMHAVDVANLEPLWVEPEMPVAEVASIMHREGIQKVLVGTDGRLQGLLTAFDLLQAVK